MSELVVGALLLTTALLFSLEIRRRRLAEMRLQETLASVEHQVDERTRALSQTMAELKQSEQDRAAALEKAETARRNAEEASQLKDQFLATASHELRTPLNAIVGWVHVLMSGAVKGEEERRHAVNAIHRNAKIQTRLIEDLLDVSRMNQGRVSLTVAPMNLRSIVDAAVDTMRHAAAAKRVVLDTHGTDDVLPVIGDDVRLQQVIWNLLSNAVKYSAPGGKVTVTVARNDDNAVVTVADTGEGIDPEFLPHVFEPFRQGSAQTMRSGLGLGLAIVKQLVDLHGGHIGAESAGRGCGARFTVAIPIVPADLATRAIPAGPRPDPDFAHLHVLVAEDDADSAAAVTAILRLHGCETQTAASASECLRITGEWPPDVLICDIGLPDDDGYGLLRRLRDLPAGGTMPAIALTAYSRPEDRAKALAAGFRAHLSKPLDPECLLREISNAVKDRSAA